MRRILLKTPTKAATKVTRLSAASCIHIKQKAPYSSTRLTDVFSQIVRQSGCVDLIDSHNSLQRSHSCKLNTVAWVELTYFHVKFVGWTR